MNKLINFLLKNRTIFITGEITNKNANTVIIQLLYLNKLNKKKSIILYINSEGGSISAGLAIYDTIRILSNNIITICYGNALSMGAVILSSGNKGKRYCFKNSRIMIHQPIGKTEGTAQEIKIHTKEILKLKSIIYKILSKNTNKKPNQIKNDTKFDKFMSAKQAIRYGIIDKIIKHV